MSNDQPSAQPEPVPSEPLPAEVLDWAKQHFSEEEFLAGLREIRETGGVTLDNFIAELERAATGRE